MKLSDTGQHPFPKDCHVYCNRIVSACHIPSDNFMCVT